MAEEKMSSSVDAPQITQDKRYAKLGCIDIETTSGVAHFHEMSGLLTSDCGTVSDEGPDKSVALWMYSTTELFGFVVQLSPKEARAFAASMITVSNAIDGGEVIN
jgi:hypothetical protein